MPGITQLRAWLCVDKRLEFFIQANEMQTSAAVSTLSIFWNANPNPQCAVYPLIVCLFGLVANVNLTREKSVFYKGQGNSNWFSALTSCWCPWQENHALNFEVQTVICYCGLKHTTCCFSLYNMLWEKIIICPGRRSHSLHLRAAMSLWHNKQK